MNQGKLEVVKQEMARANIDILGISELKWTGMGEFNSDDHYTYYCGQESLRRNGVAIMVNKRVRNAVLGCNVKNDRMISVHFQGKPFNITIIQVYALTSNAEEAEIEWFYEDWFQIGKEVHQGCILSPCLFKLYAEYIMRNAGLDEAQAGIKISGRNINLRYADDSTLVAESEELKSLLMKHNIRKTKIMASGPITSWQTEGKKTGSNDRFYFLGLQNHCGC